ncbi:formyltransferase family protein, partial [Acinetobacter baumannii]
ENTTNISHQSPNRIQVAIFASGTGTNAQKIIEHFKNHPSIEIALVVSNKPEAGVLKMATNHSVPTLIIEKEQFFRGNAYVDELKQRDIRFV